MTRLRVGVIGTGFGAQVQIPVFRAHPRIDLAAVASGTPGKAKTVAKRFGIPLAFNDYRDLIRADLDMVSITTPPYLHHPMTIAALAAHRHVLCEKPMALSATEAAEMLAEAKRQRVVALIDHELRFNPNRRKIKALVDAGFIGRPRHVLITIIRTSWVDPSSEWTWWSEAARGGGLLAARGSHEIDLLRHWLGEIESATGVVETFIKERPDQARKGMREVSADDFSAFSLRFRSGAIGVMLLSVVALHEQGPRVEIWGDEGSLRLDSQERLWGARRGQELTELTEAETLNPPSDIDYAPLWALSFVRLTDHLVSVILDSASATPAATFADGLQVQRVIDAVRTSARENWVPIAPLDERKVSR